MRRAAYVVAALGGWALAVRVTVAWAGETRRARDLDALLDDCEVERLRVERARPKSSPGRVADRAPGRESSTVDVTRARDHERAFRVVDGGA